MARDTLVCAVLGGVKPFLMNLEVGSSSIQAV